MWYYINHDDVGVTDGSAYFYPIACHESILENVLASLEELRPHAVVKECPALYFDLPGMAATDRPHEEFDFLGLHIEMPCEDVASFALTVKNILFNVQDVIDGVRHSVKYAYGYFLVAGFVKRMAFSVEHGEQFLNLLNSLAFDAERKAAEFWATRKVPSQILREAAVGPGGDINDAPDCGGHKLDRFKFEVPAKDNN